MKVNKNLKFVMIVAGMAASGYFWHYFNPTDPSIIILGVIMGGVAVFVASLVAEV